MSKKILTDPSQLLEAGIFSPDETYGMFDVLSNRSGSDHHACLLALASIRTLASFVFASSLQPPAYDVF